MSNTILIKHGNGIPDNKLMPYELGYSDDKKGLYIGGPLENGNPGKAIPISAEVVEKAKQLETARKIQIDLSLTEGASFNGSTDIFPGVKGILGIPQGGTGANSAAGILINMGIEATIAQLNCLKDIRNNIQDQLDEKASNSGAISLINGVDLIASRVLVSNESGKIAVSDITTTNLSYLDGVTSNIQIQLDAKMSKMVGTANRVIVSNDNKELAISSITATELGYLSGVTSNLANCIQTETQQITVDGNQTSTLTFSRNVKMVCVIAYQINTNATMGCVSGFWNVNTSGRSQYLYGYGTSGAAVDSYPTAVTFDGANITIARKGNLSLTYDVIAFF